MKTASAKSKGRELQKFVSRKIREVFQLNEEDVVSRPMGSPGCDIMMSTLALSKLPLSIECKNTKTFPSLSALDQAFANTNGKALMPAAVWKPPGKAMDKSIVYMNIEHFLWLLKSKEQE